MELGLGLSRFDIINNANEIWNVIVSKSNKNYRIFMGPPVPAPERPGRPCTVALGLGRPGADRSDA